MTIQHESLRLFANLFVSRRDDYAMQQADGRYLRAGRPVTYSTLFAHLLGSLTIGTYVIDERGMCRFALFDDDREGDDLEERVKTLVAVQQQLRAVSIPAYLEGSRRGCHLWVCCDRLVPASQLRRWLLPYCPAGVEFFPKQDEGTRQYGSLVRLPLGVHRRSNCRYWFFSWDAEARLHLAPVARGVSNSLAWLPRLQRAVVPDLDTLPPSQNGTGVDTPQSLAKTVMRPAPLLSATTIHAWCASQNPFEVIGRYVQLDRRGVGCCPFGDHHADGKDNHPSFKVYQPQRAGGSCWYCYVWGRGGTLFDFLCSWHGVSAKALWHRILTGEVF
jgi:CHC2 zinc finger